MRHFTDHMCDDTVAHEAAGVSVEVYLDTGRARSPLSQADAHSGKLIQCLPAARGKPLPASNNNNSSSCLWSVVSDTLGWSSPLHSFFFPLSFLLLSLFSSGHICHSTLQGYTWSLTLVSAALETSFTQTHIHTRTYKPCSHRTGGIDWR